MFELFLLDWQASETSILFALITELYTFFNLRIYHYVLIGMLLDGLGYLLHLTFAILGHTLLL